MNPAAALLRAVRGPVMLITLGLLLTAHRFGDMRFTQTWPVLLIVLGVMKLLERMATRTEFPGAGSGPAAAGGGQS